MRTSFFNHVLIFIAVLLLMGVSFSGCGPAEDEDRFRTHPEYGGKEPLSPDEDRLAEYPDYYPDRGDPGPLFPTEEPPRLPQHAADVSDVDLKRAAEAYTQIEKINRDMRTALERSQSPEEIQALQSEVNQKIVKAIEQTGLDFDGYNRIMHHVNTDMEIEERFQQKLKSTF